MTPTLAGTAALGMGALATAVLLVWFFWRPRTTAIVVASIEPFRHLERRTRLRRWREILALMLQIAAALALVAALAPDEETSPKAGASAPVVALVDVSASMAARGRLEAAQAHLAGTDWGVIAVGSSPRVLRLPGEEGDVVLEAAHGGADWAAALSLAEALGAEPIALSDEPRPSTGPERWVVVGPASDDVAIVDLTVVTGPGLPAEHRVGIAVASNAPDPQQVRVRLEAEGGVPIGETTLMTTPGALSWARLRSDPLPGEVLTATIVDTGDDRPDNDSLRAWIPPLRPSIVWIVGPGNRFLERAFGALPDVTVRTFPPGKEPIADATVDLVVYDRALPSRQNDRPSVWIAPPAGTGDLVIGPAVSSPRFVRWNREHPLLQGVALYTLHAEAATPLEVASGEEIAGTVEGAVWLATASPPRLILGFDLLRSDLPLGVALPQLCYNALLWARRGGLVERPTHSVGERLAVDPAGGAALEGDLVGVWPEGARSVSLEAPGLVRATDASSSRLVTIRSPDPLASPAAGAPAPVRDVLEPEEPEPEPWPLWLVCAMGLLLAEAFVAPRTA